MQFVFFPFRDIELATVPKILSVTAELLFHLSLSSYSLTFFMIANL